MLGWHRVDKQRIRSCVCTSRGPLTLAAQACNAAILGLHAPLRHRWTEDYFLLRPQLLETLAVRNTHSNLSNTATFENAIHGYTDIAMTSLVATESMLLKTSRPLPGEPFRLLALHYRSNAL